MTWTYSLGRGLLKYTWALGKGNARPGEKEQGRGGGRCSAREGEGRGSAGEKRKGAEQGRRGKGQSRGGRQEACDDAAAELESMTQPPV